MKPFFLGGSLLVVDSLVLYWLWTTLFPTWGDLWEAIGFWLTPDFWSAFNGELGEDLIAELKLGLAAAFSALLIGSQVHLFL